MGSEIDLKEPRKQFTGSNQILPKTWKETRVSEINKKKKWKVQSRKKKLKELEKNSSKTARLKRS